MRTNLQHAAHIVRHEQTIRELAPDAFAEQVVERVLVPNPFVSVQHFVPFPDQRQRSLAHKHYADICCPQSQVEALQPVILEEA